MSLTFRGQTRHCFPIVYTTVSSKQKNTALHWAFKLNSAAAATENWHLKGHTLKVKEVNFVCIHLFNFMFK